MNRGRISIFSRQFKKQFNNSKYNSLTSSGRGAVYDPKRILLKYTKQEFSIGMYTFTLLFSVGMVSHYYFPDSYHEFIGNKSYVATCSHWGSMISGEEHELNQKIIEREHAEHHLHEFMDSLKREPSHH